MVSLFPHPASFRFRLSTDTLAFGYLLPATGRIRVFHPLETCAAGCTKIQARRAILPSAPVCMIEMMMVSGYRFRKMPEKTFAIKAFEPLWGKRKAPAFVSKAGTYYGAEGGIWFSSLAARRSDRL